MTFLSRQNNNYTNYKNLINVTYHVYVCPYFQIENINFG